MLFLHELKQVFVLVKQFSFINKNVSQADTIHMVQHFPFSCLQQKNLGKILNFSKQSVPFIHICNTRFVQYRYICTGGSRIFLGGSQGRVHPDVCWLHSSDDPSAKVPFLNKYS